ncbi:N-acetylmuramoyl-L-alanine amidase [Bacillus sp. FJAT-47783]|uniref:N-acetylmuramoyl-L-alanine amidase n=1 Tax=Bacillus sp. FJAT-47783 TaxID=2922712 RepID=UPI001FACB5B8|nr:N-acetylmuramoyl-L-alanine amidase [Bacillus sp. FJAT-47783]
MKKVMIDPGHGGSDPGAGSNGYKEKDFNLNIALNVGNYLVAHYDVELFLTRTSDQTVSLADRTNLANEKNVDYFCSIHVNAGGGSGFESYIYNGPVSQPTIRYQAIIHDHIMSVIGQRYNVRDRGKKRANFHVLRETKMEAILVETLFIDNEADLKLLTNDAFIKDYSNALAEGLAKALQLPKKAHPIEPNPDALYKVIAGSFKVRENAEKRLQWLKANNIDSFISPTMMNGDTFYRVQAGAFKKRENAEKHTESLKAVGIFDAFIVSPSEAKTNPQIPNRSSTQKDTPIQGKSYVSGALLDAYVQTVNPSAPQIGDLYVRLSNTYQIRGDIAFAQAIHETDYFRFTGVVHRKQHNFAGIGATGGDERGASFQTEKEGVLAHLQHLYAYASTNPLPDDYPLVDPRFQLVKRGSAKTWKELNGRWAVPGDHYGQSILNIYKKILDFSAKKLEDEKAALQKDEAP